jgi:phosphoribosylaminoimidazole-succinocarboxamide synthase
LQSGHVRSAGSGKVRELFDVGDGRLLLVATDRISAYDVVLDRPIPDKGKVLTGLSYYWLRHFRDIPNHFLSIKPSEMPDPGIEDLAGRAMLCRKAVPIPVEFVVRGYLAGSGWREYVATGSTSGHRLPRGLQQSAKLPEPILTPATKAVSGHDENITEEQAAGISGPEAYDRARSYALVIYERASALAAERGVIIADTKFEFGLIDDEVTLIDEVLTPDSSRFWPKDSYRPGGPVSSFDKQYVRDWLDGQGWDHTPPAPTLADKVVSATRIRYLEAYERVAAQPFARFIEEAAGEQP